jgi:hypothetical protein
MTGVNYRRRKKKGPSLNVAPAAPTFVPTPDVVPPDYAYMPSAPVPPAM